MALSNNGSVDTNPVISLILLKSQHQPKGWTEERKQQYFLWSAKVVLGLRGSNQIMEDKIDEVLTRNGIENPKEVKLEENEKKE